MGKRLERFGEIRIIDETNGFGLDFVEKTESRSGKEMTHKYSSYIILCG